MYQLKITRPNSLLSVILEREISEKDLSVIRLVLDSNITYGEALAVLGTAWFDTPDGQFGDPALTGENGHPRYARR